METVTPRTKPSVLFICDTWCAGNEKFGKAEWEHNLWESLSETALAEVQTFHFDEYYAREGVRGDEAVQRYIDDLRPDLVCLVLYAMPGSAPNVPDWSTLAHLRDKKIPILSIWGDLQLKEQRAIAKALEPYVMLNIATASSAAMARIANPKKYLYMWVPKNPTIFNNPNTDRTINLSYVGSPKKDRLRRVRYLETHGVPVTWTGGERQAHLDVAGYADIFKKSKITLSFSRASSSHVINARPFEAMACGAMMLEQENFETPKLYTPFEDYVPYTTDADLLEKARYYLSHEEERSRIAENGYTKTIQKYSAERFWKIALNKAIGTPTDVVYDFDYTLHAAQLSALPPARALWLRALNFLSSYRLSFFIFSLLQSGFWKGHLFGLFKTLRVSLEKRLPPGMFAAVLRYKRKLLSSID